MIPKMFLPLLILILVLSLNQAEAQSVGLCRGVPCANGGRLMVDNSVWGHCRCRCLTGFVGPYCQYQLTGKRRVITTTLGNPRRRVHRSQRSKRLEQIKQQLSDLTPDVMSSSNSGESLQDSTMPSFRTRDDLDVISKILEVQNSIDDSYKHDSTLDPLWLLKNVKR
ncbi:unnamed protein product [Candidula unifasciata]|uniref:EGF-like domain-containing protein n=1 Tax=Candidula unifasciata TaxID=100452 RepID=A0A8S3Z4I2_9EUPU|nr:unnamed protein product [Candidula unifasciata]